MKQWLILAVKAAVSGLLIWWLFDGIDIASVAASMSGLAVGPLALALATIFVAVGLLSVRWGAVNHALGITLSGARTLRLTVIGMFFSQTLPTTFGGDVARIWFVYRDGIPMARVASGVVLDRLCALASLLTIVALTLPTLYSLIDDPAPRWSIPVLVVAGAAGLAALLALGGGRIAFLNRWRLTRALAALAVDSRRLVANWPKLAVVFVSSLCIHGLMMLAVWLAGQAVASEITLLHTLVLVPPVLLVSMVPISVAGWGVREGAMVVAFGFVGVPAADALVVSVLLGLVMLVAGVPGGLLWLAEGPAARRIASTPEKSES